MSTDTTFREELKNSDFATDLTNALETLVRRTVDSFLAVDRPVDDAAVDPVVETMSWGAFAALSPDAVVTGEVRASDFGHYEVTATLADGTTIDTRVEQVVVNDSRVDVPDTLDLAGFRVTVQTDQAVTLLEATPLLTNISVPDARTPPTSTTND